MTYNSEKATESRPEFPEFQTDPYSEDLHKALMALDNGDPKRPEYAGAVAVMWRKIAADEASLNDVTAFAKAIAMRVTSDLLDSKPTSPERGVLALSAIGLVKRTDENYTARAVLRTFLAAERFDMLDGPSKPIPSAGAPKGKSRRKRMLEHMRSHNLYQEIDDTNASKRIDRLVKKIEAGM